MFQKRSRIQFCVKLGNGGHKDFDHITGATEILVRKGMGSSQRQCTSSMGSLVYAFVDSNNMLSLSTHQI